MQQLHHSVFRFRAELPSDIDQIPFDDARHICVVTARDDVADVAALDNVADVAAVDNVADVEVLLWMPGWTLEDVRALLQRVADGHVMVESLNQASLYTGERRHSG